jgi:hypothetical protein
MQAVLLVTALVNFVALIVLAGVREQLSIFSKWKEPLAMLTCLCVVLWLVSIVLLMVFFPESIRSSTPDPRY